MTPGTGASVPTGHDQRAPEGISTSTRGRGEARSQCGVTLPSTLVASWLFVIGEVAALNWVVRHRVMAFRDHIRTGGVNEGDRFAMYVTRGAFHNPATDQGRIFAIGTIVSPVSRRNLAIAGETFHKSVRFDFDRPPVPPREGMPFRPLVSELGFIRKKRFWAAYLRRALVQITEADLRRLDTALRRYEASTQAR